MDIIYDYGKGICTYISEGRIEQFLIQPDIAAAPPTPQSLESKLVGKLFENDEDAIPQGLLIRG